MSIERVRQLGCWQSTQVTIEPLAGGITNRNYLVRDGDTKFVVRQCSEGAHLGIDRRNERACHAAAARAGIAPALRHHEAEFLVCDFVAGRTLSAADLHEPDRLARAARALRFVHDAWPELTGEMLYFSPFQTVRTYAQTAAAGKASLPADLDRLLADIRRLEATIAPFRPVLCHNDLLPANLIDTGSEVRIVDWELAGIGHPLFDLGGFISNAGLPDALAEQLLTDYGLPPAAVRRELLIFQALSLLREALWGAVQSVRSTLPFDYREYAQTHFDKYRAVRARMP